VVVLAFKEARRVFIVSLAFLLGIRWGP
jgi:hypothetical protein